jgi:hypothetical protein
VTANTGERIEVVDDVPVSGGSPSTWRAEGPMNRWIEGTGLLETLARWLGVALIAWCSAAGTAAAGPREQAKRMHDRLVGVPPSAAVLDSMADSIASDDLLGAAYEAMSAPEFYRTALKNFVTPWTNTERTVFAELNDYTATVIGMIRDDVPFDEILSADLIYVAAPGVVSSAYSHSDNAHYRELEESRADLGDPAVLVPMLQSDLPGTPLGPGDTAGVVTTRAAAEAYFSAGTNRRMWRFVALNFLCRDMEDLKDISRPADRIRQDVSRSPGGDSSIFQNHCVGCHSGMDPVAGAIAYYEWDPENTRLAFSRGQVQGKYLINANTFSYGYITFDDRWDNYWRGGPNSVLDWRGPNASGFGAKSLGEEVTASRAFSICQVEKVFEQICFRPAESAEDRAAVELIADVFEAENYSMKRAMAETALHCMGE